MLEDREDLKSGNLVEFVKVEHRFCIVTNEMMKISKY